MWRSLIAATFLYGYGHPSFDGFRPSALDRPLQSFYGDVNHWAAEGRRALTTLDDARSMRYLKSYIGHMGGMLRGD